MTKEEAQAACARIAAEHPERENHQWIPVPRGGEEWAVAKIPLPPSSSVQSGTVKADSAGAPGADTHPGTRRVIGG